MKSVGKNRTPTLLPPGCVSHFSLDPKKRTFDLDGNFWGVLRNEDGDPSGFGSRVAFAPKERLWDWQLFPLTNKSDPNIYESSRMFRHGELMKNEEGKQKA